ncbi:hypothetical protein DPMN_140627 [Dreissena polymorpha]|uniref:Uncharacterized protein n=1 Tax=Dreissena polymorpha TaxID=45954 RepID=A0A9D4GB97_DREPO|nr:hypothetical protein DPMN_140627 [Dreissena polymorpha]
MTTPPPVASGAGQGAKLGQGSPVAKAVILPSNAIIFLNAPANPLGLWAILQCHTILRNDFGL